MIYLENSNTCRLMYRETQNIQNCFGTIVNDCETIRYTYLNSDLWSCHLDISVFWNEIRNKLKALELEPENLSLLFQPYRFGTWENCLNILSSSVFCCDYLSQSRYDYQRKETNESLYLHKSLLLIEYNSRYCHFLPELIFGIMFVKVMEILQVRWKMELSRAFGYRWIRL